MHAAWVSLHCSRFWSLMACTCILPRDAYNAPARYMSCGVITLVYFLETTELIIKQLAQDVAWELTVMDTKHRTLYFRGSPHQGVKERGVVAWRYYAWPVHLHHSTVTAAWPASDIERRAVPLRQLSFLLLIGLRDIVTAIPYTLCPEKVSPCNFCQWESLFNNNGR